MVLRGLRVGERSAFDRAYERVRGRLASFFHLWCLFMLQVYYSGSTERK